MYWFMFCFQVSYSDDVQRWTSSTTKTSKLAYITWRTDALKPNLCLFLSRYFPSLKVCLKWKTTKYNNNQRKPSFDWVRLDGANVISTVVMFDSIMIVHSSLKNQVIFEDLPTMLKFKRTSNLRHCTHNKNMLPVELS